MLTPVPPTDCARACESASARLDGELAELQDAALEAHLALCPDCRAYAEGIAVTAVQLREAPLLQPAAPMFVLRRRRRVGVAHVAAAAAMVVAVAGSSFAVGGILGRRGTHVPPPTATQTSALAGSLDQFVLPLLRGTQPSVQVTSKIVAL